MRIQHVAVMFVIIFIPIILVTSYFISLQVNSIRLESDYSDKLLKATYDAMTAFELNTANEDLSTVSDSLRSILDASTNIFFNTLCTNLGVSNASKSFVQPYIPAILYTMYDGYYIYSPTNIPEVCTDDFGRTIRTSDYGVTNVSPVTVSGKTIGVYQFSKDAIDYDENTPTEPAGGTSLSYDNFSGIEQEYGQILYKNIDGSYSTELHTWTGATANQSTYYKRSYILKSYIPYSARYSGSTGAGPERTLNFDITINYTLDNFLSVEGNIGNIYYTKSGYLTEKDLVSEIIIVDSEGTTRVVDRWDTISEDEIIGMIKNPGNFEVTIHLKDGTEISNKDGTVDVTNTTGGGTTRYYWDDAQSAIEYYVKSYIFSNWFFNNLSGVGASSLQNTQYSITEVQDTLATSITEADGNPLQTKLENEMLHNFEGDATLPFRESTDTDNNNPESEESDFYEHKRDVIKNSITYNMVLSMLVYTEDSSTNEFNMPVLQETEWDTILKNVSITAFMQGMNCGLKYFNSYAIVTSTNNEISVTDNEIYYAPRVIQEIDTDGDTDPDMNILANLEDSNYDSVIETAHRIDCEKLRLGDINNFYTADDRTYWLGCISFKSKEIKYDKILNKDGSYTYDHRAYTDYNCIVDSNYIVRNVDDTIKDGNTDILTYLIENANNDSATDTDLQDQLRYKLLAYRIAIAKERNNLYKTTAFPENYGWQVVFNPTSMVTPVTDIVLTNLPSSTTIDISSLTKKNINEISRIEVTLEYANTSTIGLNSDIINAQYDTGENYEGRTIATTTKSRTTLEFIKDFDTNSNVSNITISSGRGTRFYVHSIKFYYK